MESKNTAKAMKLMAAGFILAPSLAMADSPALDALKATAGSEATMQVISRQAPAIPTCWQAAEGGPCNKDQNPKDNEKTHWRAMPTVDDSFSVGASASAGAITVKELVGSWVLDVVKIKTKDGKESSYSVPAGKGVYDFKADGSFTGTDLEGNPVAGKWQIENGKLDFSNTDGSPMSSINDITRVGDKLTMTTDKNGDVLTGVFSLSKNQ